MLEALGIDPEGEDIYGTLLDNPPLTLSELTRAHAVISAGRMRRILDTLEAKGLVTRTNGTRTRYSPAPPDALEKMLAARERQLHEARVTVAALADRYRGLPGGIAHAVEIVLPPAAEQRLGLNHLSARQEVRAFECPPYRVPPRAPNPDELDKIAQGVRYRVVYGRSAVEAQSLGNIRAGIVAGEEARVVGDVPLRMLLIDDRLAMLPLQRGRLLREGIFVVQPSALLDALSSLFELVWSQALPLDLDRPKDMTAGRPARDGDGEALLALLAAGLPDMAIARQLGISRRTVERRVHAVMIALNARSRFQAGARVGYRQQHELQQPLAGEHGQG